MSSAKKRLEQIDGHIQNDRTASKETTTPSVAYTVHEHSPGNNVATIVFSNPSKLNVANGQLLDKLIQVCEELGKDDALRAVVLKGAPPSNSGKAAAFIGGADIQELHALAGPDEARVYIIRVHRACKAIMDIPVPVIASVHGYALGAGLELMTACDLKIATRDSKFGMPEPKIGVPSLVEAALFPGTIGMGRTKRLVYLAENISAKQAEAWGLIERVVEDEKALEAAVNEWVSTIVGMGPQSIRNQKRLVRKWQNSTLEEGIQAGIESIAETYADGGVEAKQYMKPFLGKNKS